MEPIIAIVGRPNVGKSSLFNRMLGKRAAVVDDLPGVTRDRNYRPLAWQKGNFLLVDTGGMMVQEKEMLHRSINAQIRQAIDEASAVLFIVEAGTGITGEDEILARMLRRQAIAKTILVVNKAESPRARYELDVFRNLGLGDPWPVSALHGKGVADVLDEAAKIAKQHVGTVAEKPVREEPLRIAIVGRPNVGKSSLVNKLLRQERMIVDDAAGTTRDSIDTEMIWGDRRISLIDTAGLRKKSHVKEDLEYYFNLRAIKSIDRCDVCAVIVDAGSEIGIQDLRIIRKAMELHKGIFVAFNKWDTVPNKGDKTFDHLVADIKCEFLELRQLPMLAISALTGRRVTAVIDTAIAIKERMGVRVPAAEFEDTVFTWNRTHPHPAIPNEPVRFLGARQMDAPYPFFRFFVTYPRNVSPHYVRYLMNKIYEKYGFEGCPLKLEFKTVLKPGGKRGNESGGEKAEVAGPAAKGRKRH